MSALSLIRDYGDISSEDTDSECEKNTHKGPKLPRPNLDKVTTVPTEQHQDNPALQGGKVRSFPHVRGNWATFVYVNYFDDDIVNNLILKLKNLALTIDETCAICDNIHISLSRTVVLQYHVINTFTAGLTEGLCNFKRFNIQFDSVEVYCNDEQTRTFIALKVDHCSEKFLLNITTEVNKILEDFKLPPFYKDPSYHSSILWVNGNQKSKFEGILEKLNNILSEELEKNPRSYLIDKVNCKIGHKLFQYCLT